MIGATSTRCYRSNRGRKDLRNQCREKSTAMPVENSHDTACTPPPPTHTHMNLHAYAPTQEMLTCNTPALYQRSLASVGGHPAGEVLVRGQLC